MKIIVCKIQKGFLKKRMRPLWLGCVLTAVPLLLSAWTAPVTEQPAEPAAIEQQTVPAVCAQIKSAPLLQPEEQAEKSVPEKQPAQIDAIQPAQTDPTPPESAEPVYADVPLSEELQAFAVNLCEEQSVPYALVLAVIEHESNFDETATHINANGTTDSGLMQLNDIVRDYVQAQYGVTDLLDPKQNLTAGIGILSEYLAKYDVKQAVMAYALGETGMKKAHANGRTSTAATDEILALMQHYTEPA